jgi:methylated-DNA-[protein]-cysteine S-methyltransferase
MPLQLQRDRIASPIGTILVVFDDEGHVHALDFDDYEDRMYRLLRQQCGVQAVSEGTTPASVRRALTAYFAGDLEALAAVRPRTGGTAFQNEVWTALRTIPAGTTISYGQLAAKIGRPKASRAVGLANGSNPVAIVVPCHRVIGSDGSLTGYGGGLPRKQWLLEHERNSRAHLSAAHAAAAVPA